MEVWTAGKGEEDEHKELMGGELEEDVGEEIGYEE